MSLGRVRKGFDLDGGEDWLVADGLTFRNYNDNAIHSIGSNNCVFRNVTTYTNFITGIYLTSGSNNCLIERCKFWDNGHGGIELASTRRTTIRKNWFLRRDRGDGFGGNGAHMWLGPVGALADSNLIENNLAFATGRQSYRGPFLAVAGSYNVIRHNSIACPGGAFALLDGGHNVLVNNACDFSGAVHGIAVFPNAVADSGHFIRGNDLYALDPFEEYWWNNVRFSSVAAWESAAAQTGNFDTLPGFADPIAENLHLTETSFCLDQGTDTLAAGEDFDGVARPVGPGYDIGAYEFLPTGAGEGQQPTAVSLRPAPTIVRGVLWLGGLGHDPDSQGGIGSCPAHLLDISGRKVLDLHSGANDVSRLAPGVYFVWAVSRGLSAESCHKVVIQR
jgi:parallel beta-helix repeat protein